MKPILFATDFSDRAARAEQRAAMLCQELGAPVLELCNVKEHGLLAAVAGLRNVSQDDAAASVQPQVLDELERRCALLASQYGIACSQSVRFGAVARQIGSRADETGAGLIVVGAQGGNFFSDLFIGSTADRLVHLAAQPVLVVKNQPRQHYRHVLVPVDFSEDSRLAAEMALLLAPKASFTFLHVFDVAADGLMRYAGVDEEYIRIYRNKARDDAGRALNGFLDTLNLDGRNVTRQIVYGIASVAVRLHAEALKPDLIAIGKHGRSRFEELLIGSVTRDTLEQTRSDLLVVSGRTAAGA